MIARTRWAACALAACLAGRVALGQALNNQQLSGQYFFRHVSLDTAGSGSVTGARSLIGTVSFDGTGHYSFTGQQVTGINPPAPQANSGAYSIDAAGTIVMDNPLRAGAKINARVGPEAVVGSSTEATGNVFDLFVAIPAPASAAAASLTGSFWTATLEFPAGNSVNARDTFSRMVVGPLGRIGDFTVTGHAANISNGAPLSQQVIGAVTTMARDGIGSILFGADSNRLLLSGSKTLLLSADGNVILGGTPAAGSHDILIGVKAGASNADFGGTFWNAGLRITANIDPADPASYAGSVAARGPGKLVWTRRIKSLARGGLDFTGVTDYVTQQDGSAALTSYQTGLGAAGKAFVGAAVSDPKAYEIFVGTQAQPASGSGIFLDPQRIFNAASFAPVGNPIAPGEYIALFGSGLAKSSQTAAPPYPPSLDGVTVLVGGKPAPLYYVSASQINCLVPFGTQGPTTTIVVQNGGTNSNTVTVAVADTAPGVFSLDGSGTGLGAVLHSDYSLVNAANPAARGEMVLIFLTGLGAVTPPLADGALPGSEPLNKTVAAPTVLVAGEEAEVQYSGLVPGVPGLYQLNIVVPPYFPTLGNLPLAISIGKAFHDQVDIAVQ